MSKKRSVLERMRANPRGQWRIEDVERLCREVGLDLHAPSRGSHYKVVSVYLADVVTIPFKRPIKAPYIRTLVSFADAHNARRQGEEDNDE